RTFFDLRQQNGYLAIISFLHRSSGQPEPLDRLRDIFASALEVPVLLARGITYLHSFERVLIEGPPNGLFLILTAHTAGDIPIPGAGYRFAQLQLALARAGLDALQSNQKPVARLHLAGGVESGLADFEQLVQQALNIPAS